MINLLPPAHKRALVYARRNIRLRQGAIGLCVGLLLLVVVTTGNYLILRQETNTYRNNTTALEQELKENDETETLGRMREISGTLNTVLGVLSQQILFADLFQRLGSIMPSGVVLQGISLQGAAAGGISLQISATSQFVASQALANIQDPTNRVFERADLENITCDYAPDNEPYFCTGSIRATFFKDSQFSFLGKATEDAQ